jgi:uncharacterized repeat protein (TIGR02543 family)
MKKRKIFLGLVTAAATLGLAACKTDDPNPTPPNPPVEVTTYTVTFENNGHGEAPKEVKEVTKLPTLPTLEEEGWTFEGWYYDSALTKEAEAGEEITANTKLYAKWTKKEAPAPEKYTVRFDSQKGTEVSAKEVEKGKKVAKPEDPTREGYIFKGWYKEAGCTNAWNFDTDVVDKDLTLFAKWTKKVYEVSFISNGGSEVPTQKVEHGDKALRPSPTRDNFLFIGWYRDKELKLEFDFVNTSITENIILYAKWEEVNPEVITVTFNSKLGSEVPPITNIVSGQKISKPKDPTREGYIFIGWFKDTGGELTEEFDFENDVVTESMVLFAKWEEVSTETHIVTFDSNGGSEVPSQEVLHGTMATTPTKPTKKYYTFVGWYTEAVGGVLVQLEEIAIEESTTFYAHWMETEATLIQITPSNVTLLVGDTLGLNVVFSPVDILNKNITWESSNEEIAIVDENGMVTTLADGIVTIFAKHGDLIAECRITVEKPDVPVEDIKIKVGEGDVDRITLTPTHPQEILSVIPHPVDATKVRILWSSSNPAVATVEATDEFGLEALVMMVSQGDSPIVITATVEGKEISNFVFCTADTLYGELVKDENLILNETFVGYEKDSKLPLWNGEWGTLGVYGAFAKNSNNPDEAVSYDTNYVMIKQEANGNNRAELVDDASMNGATKLIWDFGKLDGIVKGYINIKLLNAGSSWTPIQFYGSNKKEVFGLRFDGNIVKYRLNGGTVVLGETQINITQISTLRMYFEVDMETGVLNLVLNGETFVSNLELPVKEIIGIQFVSSNSGAKTLSLDNMALVNIPLTLEECQAKVLELLDNAYLTYDSTLYTEENWNTLDTIYTTAKEALTVEATKENLQVLLDKALLDMKAVETEAMAALRVSKEEALATLDLVDTSLYTLNLDILTALLEETNSTITACTTVEAVTECLNSFNTSLSEIEQDEAALLTLKNEALEELALIEGGDVNFTTDFTLLFKNDDGTTTSRAYNNVQTYKNAYDGGVLAIELAASVHDGITYLEAKAAIELALANATTSILDCSTNEEMLQAAKTEAEKHVRDYKATDRSIDNIPDCEVPEDDPEYYDKNVIINQLNDILRTRINNIEALLDITKIQVEINDAENYIDTFLQTYKTTFAELKASLLLSYDEYFNTLKGSYEEDSEIYLTLNSQYLVGKEKMEAILNGKAALNAAYRDARNRLGLVMTCYENIDELNAYAVSLENELPYLPEETSKAIDAAVAEEINNIKAVIELPNATTADFTTALAAAKDRVNLIVLALKETKYTISLENSLDSFEVKYGEGFTLKDVHVTAKNVIGVSYPDADGNYIPMTEDTKVVVFENMLLQVDVEDIEGFEGALHWTSTIEVINAEGDAFEEETNPYFTLVIPTGVCMIGTTTTSGKSLTGGKVTIKDKDFTSVVRMPVGANADSEVIKLVINENLSSLDIYLKEAGNNGTDARTGNLYYNISNEYDDLEASNLAYNKADSVETKLTLSNLTYGNVVRIYLQNNSKKSDGTALGANLFIGGIDAVVDLSKATKDVSIQWGNDSEPTQYHYFDVIEAPKGPASPTEVFQYWYYLDGENEVQFESKAYPSGTTLVMLAKTLSANVTINYVVDDITTPESYIVMEGESGIPEPDAPVKEGYTFLGWYTEGDTLFDFASVTAGTIATVTAKFEEITTNIQTLGFTQTQIANVTQAQINAGAYDAYGIINLHLGHTSAKAQEKQGGLNVIKFGGKTSSTNYIKIDLTNYEGTATIKVGTIDGSGGRTMFLATKQTNTVTDAIEGASATSVKNELRGFEVTLECGKVYYICTNNTCMLAELTVTLDLNSLKA